MHRALILFVAAAFAGAACSSNAASSNPSVSSSSPATTLSATNTTAPATTDPATTDAATTDPATTDPATTDPATTDAATSVPVDDTAPADRPFQVFVPTGYDASTPTPLVLLLHGYWASGAIQEAYFQLQPLAEQRGFLYVRPDGTRDLLGNQFWNATDACCGFVSTVDDSAYLMSVIDQVERDYNVDRRRIFLIGHSNGGFMSYRMACDHADTIAAIVSMAGATFADPSKCAPSEPVSVLQIHGTLDSTIEYEGGNNFGRTYPSAAATVATWAEHNGCAPSPVPSAETRDVTAQIDGAETSVATFGGCPSGIDVELWTVVGGPHVPALSTTFATDAIDFLFSHPKS